MHTALEQRRYGFAIGTTHVSERPHQRAVDVADQELVARRNRDAQAEAGAGYTDTRRLVRLECSYATKPSTNANSV